MVKRFTEVIKLFPRLHRVRLGILGSLAIVIAVSSPSTTIPVDRVSASVTPAVLNRLQNRSQPSTLNHQLRVKHTASTQLSVVQQVYFFQQEINGKQPSSGLFLARDGNYYGVTQYGGTSNAGTIYRLTPKGVVTPVYSFNYKDGSQPTGTLVEDGQGNLYGTTLYGGTKHQGTIFRYELNGTFKSLFSFDTQNNTGQLPNGLTRSNQTLGNNRIFYGTTSSGSNYGTVFAFEVPGNTFKVLHQFTKSKDEPIFPKGKLVQAMDGNFYGVSDRGGPGGNGTVFRVTPAGKISVLFSFSASAPTNHSGFADWRNGFGPQSLTLGRDGHLYGVTSGGGSLASGGHSGGGVIFKISPTSGKLDVLHRFNVNDGKGAYPSSKLLQASDGNFYGTTEFSGAQQKGVLFRLTPGGSFKVLHSFSSAIAGQPHRPTGELVQAWDGNLLGTAVGGYGAIYRVGTRLKPLATDGITVTVDPTVPPVWANSPSCENKNAFTGWQSGAAIAGLRATSNKRLGGLIFRCIDKETNGNGFLYTDPLPLDKREYKINPADMQYFFGTYVNSGQSGFSSKAVEVCHFNSFVNAKARCFIKASNNYVYAYTPALNTDQQLSSQLPSTLQVTIVQIPPRDQQVTGQCFKTVDDAAVAALRSIAGTSWNADREYFGTIRRCWGVTPTYGFTVPKAGEKTGSPIAPDPLLGDVATYHTHNYGELMSFPDKNGPYTKRGYPAYIRGPSGTVYKYTYGDKEEIVVRTAFN